MDTYLHFYYFAGVRSTATSKHHRLSKSETSMKSETRTVFLLFSVTDTVIATK